MLDEISRHSARRVFASDKDGLGVIGPPCEVSVDPEERLRREEESPLLVALPDDPRLPPVDIERDPVERKGLRDPRTRPEQDLDDRSEPEPKNRRFAPIGVPGEDRLA